MENTEEHTLTYSDYSVAIICPLMIEMSAVRYMLDKEHSKLPQKHGDLNRYIFGELSHHNVVIGYLPQGKQGIGAAATVAADMRRTFENIRISLLVGIGGGIPSDKADIRLGDVVMSMPDGVHGGVVEYDLGKDTTHGFQRKGSLRPPPEEWLSAVVEMQSDHLVASNKIEGFISAMLATYPQLQCYTRPSFDSDILFPPNIVHSDGQSSCRNCDKTHATMASSSARTRIFYGTIASGDRVIKDAEVRDAISHREGGALCFEMEAAGLNNSFPCVVIRGICDYADSHKNDRWHGYAAAVAAGCAKELLSYIQVDKVLSGVDQRIQSPKTHFANASNSNSASVTDKRYKLLSWLKAVDIETIRRENKKAPGTCEWIKAHDSFIQWQSGTASRYLWIRGIPGCGKSVLASALVDWLSDEKDVLYFFCRGMDPEKRSIGPILRTLIYQLLQCKIFTVQESSGHIDIYEKMLGICHAFDKIELVALDTLWRMFESILPHSLPITILIDGLDECDFDQSELSFLIEQFQCMIDSHHGLRVVILSRDMQVLQKCLRSGMRVLTIQNADVQDDIHKMVAQSVSDSTKLSMVAEKVVPAVTHGSRGMFLWARLMIADLETAVSLRTIQQKLQKMPHGLGPMYSKIIFDLSINLDEDGRRYQHEILSWIVSAARPLKLEELRLALSITPEVPEIADIDLILDIRGDVTKLCGPLVTIQQDGTIRLIHFSAREALLGHQSVRGKQASEDIVNETHWVDPDHAHSTMGRVCLTYMTFPFLALTSTQIGLVAGAEFVNEVAESMPFIRYAASFWSHHLTSSSAPKVDLVELVIHFVKSDNCFAWLECYSAFAVYASGEFGHHFQVQAKLREWVSQSSVEIGNVLENYVLRALERAADNCQHQFGPRDEGTLSVMSRLGTFLAFVDQHKASRNIRAEVFAGYNELFGIEDIRTRKACTDLGYVMYMLDEFEQAEELFYLSLGGTSIESWGDTIFDFETMKELGTVYWLQTRFDEARNVLEHSMKGMIHLLTERHRLVVLCRQYLAAVYRKLGEHEKALETSVAGHKVSVEIQGEDHPDTLRGITFIAKQYMEMGKIEAAADMYEQLLQQQLRVLEGNHADTIWTIVCIGVVLRIQGRTVESRYQLQVALTKTRNIFGIRHSTTSWIASELYTTLKEAGQAQEASDLFMIYDLNPHDA